MKIFVMMISLLGLCLAQSPYQDPNQPTEARVADLLSQMTLAEKVGQMTQINVSRLMGEGEWDRGPLNEDWLKIIFDNNQVGSILSGGGAAPVPNRPQAWAEMSNQLQQAALGYSRLGIPMIYGIDAVHGHNNVLGATLYPHNLGLAASWNPELVKQIALRVGQDVRAVGSHWTFAPVADVGRDPRWGRFYESFGEDPLLAAELVAASVRGFQEAEVAATVKHFAGYGQPFSGVDRSPTFLDMRSLRTVHLPSFQAGIDAGAMAMMVNSGSLNGIPVHASAALLRGVAREEMGFEGLMISDWEDIHKLVGVHRVATNFKEAVAMSINAGVDMYMVPHDADGFTSTLTALVEEGVVPEARIDEAVARILTLKFELGLFERPLVDVTLADALVIEEERGLAKQAATESLTLLENNGVLPIAEDTEMIFVVGPAANSLARQMGGWTIGWQGLPSGEQPPGLTVIEAIEEQASDSQTILYNSGRDQAKVDSRGQQADVIVAVVGEEAYAEGEGDSSTISLAEDQLVLLRQLIALDKPLVVILIAGRPLLLPDDILRHADALIMAYLPGSEAGTALAEVLFGEVSPSGKLPFSWPRHTGQLPLSYDVLANTSYDPLYAFGYGLSYTRFSQSNLTAELQDDGIHFSIEVANRGDMAGQEVVQIYASYPPVGVMTPERKLVGFAKVKLAPDESKTLDIVVPLARLAVIRGDILGTAEAEVVAGRYQFQVGQARVGLVIP